MQYRSAMERFVGRKEEIAFFEQWLQTTDSDAPWILYLYDKLEEREKKGGVGKTWLLRQFATVARQISSDLVIVSIDFFNVVDRDGVVIAIRVVEAIKAIYPTWTASTFVNASNDYLQELSEDRDDLKDTREKVAEALVSELRQLEDTLQGDQKHLLILFDTFELVEQNPGAAALHPLQSFPDSYQFARIGIIIAGRNAIDWNSANWRGREYEVESMAIAPFTPEEMLEYFNRASLIDFQPVPAQVEALHRRTGGRPILVGLASDVLNLRIRSLQELIAIPGEQFEASLVAQINNMDTPLDSIVLFMAHIYRRFNFEILDLILREAPFHDLLRGVDRHALEERVLQLSFVRRSTSGDSFVLHDEMRPLVIHHCWSVQDPDGRMRKSLSTCAIHYYEQKLKDTIDEELRQAYLVEQLYHTCYVDLNRGYDTFRSHIFKAINLYATAFAHSLLQEMMQFMDVLPPHMRDEVRFAEARLSQAEGNPQRAMVLYERLEVEADEVWRSQRLLRFLLDQGECLIQIGRYDEAIACLTEATRLDPTLVRIPPALKASSFLWLGIAYRRIGRLDTALSHYQQALTLYKELGSERAQADALMNMGRIYSLQGKIDEALRACWIGMRARKELVRQGRMSEVYLGWSLNAIGRVHFQVDDLLKAEQAYQQAYEIFYRTGFRFGLSVVYNRFGQIALTRSELDMNLLDQAQQWFEQGYQMALGIDAEEQINSLNKQGRILMQKQKWEGAADMLRRAIDMAQRVRDAYQEAESHIDLGVTLGRMGLHDVSEQELQLADKISKRYNYHLLLGLSFEARGDLLYDVTNYQAAFQAYGEACRHLTAYNTLRFNQMVRKLTDLLLQVPDEEIGSVVNDLVAYWTEHDLAQTHPELMKACAEIQLFTRS